MGVAGGSAVSVRGGLFAVGFIAALGFAGSALAGPYDFGSSASEFLQSKTLSDILHHEDINAPGCREHHPLKAAVVVAPVVKTEGKVTERKWTERWTVDRCGTPVAYWVFFTEVGKGGAYISLVDPK